MHRVVIFTHSVSRVPAILIRGTLAALYSRDDLELTAVCLPTQSAGTLRRSLMDAARLGMQALFSRGPKNRYRLALPINLKRWARRFHFEVQSDA